MVLGNVTRGFGLLENFLSFQRVKIAKKLISEYGNGNKTILDIGCGSYPFFLTCVNFDEKYGLDNEVYNQYFKNQNLRLIEYNINNNLPFQSYYFDVITLLAVIEHLYANQMHKILMGCYSLLKKGGILIITTPARWSDMPLKLMTKVGLVSFEEVGEHKYTYNLRELRDILRGVNFKCNNIYGGFFEFFLNLWVCAIKGKD
ncbi:hypothetical protein LCGC14_0755520 [marine sediment metagenome]|uniref:Methyltransferase type 11 domain-containing protein n=1 Tax=marine sediment metagenome TaxID=412755 RepID=A0A0F9Q6W6_9ZZZZ